MKRNTRDKLALKFAPLTPARWTDLEELFGERGACGGCWCMVWRLASWRTPVAGPSGGVRRAGKRK